MDELLEIIAEMTARMPTDTLMHLADEIQSIDDVSELYTIQFNPNLRSLCNRFLDVCESSNCSTTNGEGNLEEWARASSPRQRRGKRKPNPSKPR